jgi:radical SAM PhpK family P-methyltransferase
MKNLDCIVIGYNEPPFSSYESLLRQYGDDSEAYRDLKLSFVEIDGRKMTYVDLLNHSFDLAWGDGLPGGSGVTFLSGDIPSLAAAYLTSFLRRRGLSAEYINLFQVEKERLRELLERNPLCVAITTTLYVINFPVIEMVEFIREHNPGVKIVVGGPLVANHVRNYNGESLEAAFADIGADIYIVEGQGELTLSQLVHCLRSGGDLGTVPNLIYRDGSRFHTTVKMLENNSLDESYVDWDALSGESLGPTLQTRTARSCAFKCAFCSYPTRAGALTLSSLETIEKELDSMARRGNIRELIFIDDTFNVPLPRFKDICRLMIRKDYEFDWYSYFRCSNSDEEAVELMGKSGCKGVFLGIESGSPAILEKMNKAASADKYRRGIDWLKACGILTFASFIIGFPGETDDTVEETIDFIRETEPDYYRTQLWYNEPGTPIHQARDKHRIVGDGFVWSHASMSSMEAMDHIERLFLSIKPSLWMPQWSFDFWIIPYLRGRGISLERFREFMKLGHEMLALEIASLPASQKKSLQDRHLGDLTDLIRGWRSPALS